MLKTTLIASSVVLSVACGNNAETKTDAVNNDTTKAVAAAAADNSLTDEERKDGWELLFDGASVKGWHKYGDPSKAGAAWRMEDGMLLKGRRISAILLHWLHQ